MNIPVYDVRIIFVLRLGLERGKTAESALTAIIDLLSAHGQGGLCTEGGMTYHNSFLICDNKEAWILETADHLWVAERITGTSIGLAACPVEF